jgi:hypothetical protein
MYTSRYRSAQASRAPKGSRERGRFGSGCLLHRELVPCKSSALKLILEGQLLNVVIALSGQDQSMYLRTAATPDVDFREVEAAQISAASSFGARACRSRIHEAGLTRERSSAWSR